MNRIVLKVLYGLTFILMFSIYCSKASYAIDTASFIPSTKEISTIYKSKFHISKNDFYPSYTNIVKPDFTGSAVLLTDNHHRILYIEVGKYNDIDKEWQKRKKIVQEVAGRNHQHIYHLNVGDDGFKKDGSWSEYYARYKDYLIWVMMDQYYDGEILLRKIVDNIKYNKKAKRGKTQLVIKGLYYDKSNWLKKKKLKTRIEIFKDFKKIYDKTLNVKVNLKDEGSVYTLTVSIFADKKLEGILNKGGKFLFSLGIEGYKPFLFYVDRNDISHAQNNIVIFKNLSETGEVFSRPNYCKKSGSVYKAVVHNIKEHKYYWLGKAFSKYVLKEYNETDNLGGVEFIESVKGLSTPQLELSSDGRLIIVDYSGIYKIENGSLKLLDKPTLYNGKPVPYGLKDIYIFKGEVIANGEWAVPTYFNGIDKKPIMRSQSFNYSRHFNCDVELKLKCGSTIKTVKRTVKFVTEGRIIPDWKGYKIEGNLAMYPSIDFSKLYDKNICSLEDETHDCGFVDYLDGRKVKEFSGTSDYHAGMEDKGPYEFNIPIDFGLRLPVFKMDQIINRFEGPYRVLKLCRRTGEVVDFEVYNTGWFKFKKAKEVKLDITVFKKGYLKQSSQFFVRVDNTSKLVIYGRVFDKDSSKPIKGAIVKINSQKALTNDKGFYRVSLAINNSGKVSFVSQSFHLKKKASSFEVKLDTPPLYPDNRDYKIKLTLFDDNGAIKNSRVDVKEIKNFTTKDGKKIILSGDKKYMPVYKQVVTNQAGEAFVNIHISDINIKKLKQNHTDYFPVKADLYVCIHETGVCRNVELTLLDPAPEFSLRIPGGIEEGIWQEKSSRIDIKDPDSREFEITIKAVGRIKSKGENDISSVHFHKKIQSDSFEFFYEPAKFGSDINDLPDELNAYFTTNLNVLYGLVGLFGDKISEGKVAGIMLKSEAMKKTLKFGGRSTAYPAIYLSTQSMAQGTIKADVPTAINVMDYSLGMVDFVSGVLNETKASKLLGEKQFRIIKNLRLGKLKKVADAVELSSIPIEVLKAVYANAKTTYDLFGQYRDIAYAYRDIIFLPVEVEVEDELGYKTTKVVKVGVRVYKKNSE
ncbi:hypothetical protein [Hippea jasoniae]|uniref:hypothetical protein n=1 Tax=Hippea jasoniae TaxID=944479 RepID=UPI0005510D97|nr:hypothetical protein [Hippea jasoniae]